MHSGIVSVEGSITGQTLLYKLIKTNYVCTNCGHHVQTIYDKFISTRFKNRDKSCPNCNEKCLPTDEYVNAITIELQDPDSFSEVERLPVVLFDEDTKNIQVGEKVIVEGDIQIIPSNIKETLSTYVYAKSIQYENREVLTLTQQDIEAIERFAKLNGSKVIDKLASMFAPSIIG